MQSLNTQATAIFRRIVEGLTKPGDHKKIDNAKGTFMALCVDVVRRQGTALVISFAHYFEQNGDLCCDPDMTFLVTAEAVTPLTFQQAIPPIYQEAVEFDSGKMRVKTKLQADLTSFANDWIKNIAEQQGI